MSKQVYSKPNVLEVPRYQPHNSSSTAINSSFLHQGYYSGKTTLSLPSSCDYCKKAGLSSLISICECHHKLFHQSCFRQWLSEMVRSKQMSIMEEEGSKVVECGICHSKIKFKAQVNARCSRCSEMSEYCSSHKAFTVGIIFNIVLILASIACLVMIFLGILTFKDSAIQRPAVLIALGIVILILVIVCLCCSMDCLKAEDISVETIYDRSGRIHKGSSRSRRSSRSRSRKSVNIENLE